MNRFAKIGLLTLCVSAVVAAAGCIVLPKAGTNGNGTFWSSGNGSVTGTGVSGTVTNAEVYFEHVSEGTTNVSTMYILTGAEASTSNSSFTFSSPTGATGSFTVVVDITGVPTTGAYSSSSSNACGDIGISVMGGSVSEGFTASSSGTCGGGNNSSEPAVGNWTLNITSATSFTGASVAGVTAGYYTVHGTLTGTLVNSQADGGMPESVSLQLSF